jgi:hypothetical protein
MNQEALSIAESLAPHEVKALRILFRRSLGEFERLGAMTGLGQTMIDRFIDSGLAEQGVVNAFTGAIGYRATELGRDVFAALDQRRPVDQSRLVVIEPRLKPPPASLRKKNVQ